MQELWNDEEWRAAMSTKDINDLDDSDFAYIEDGGTKDDEGKTTPRSLRHYPIQDAAHVRNALARAGAAMAGDDADAKTIAEKAMPKIKSAAKKFDIEVDESKSDGRRKPRGSRELTLQTKCRRTYSGQIEVRAAGKDATTGNDLVELSGQVIGYETPYEVHDMFGTFTETIHRDACKDLLASPALDVCFLVGHDSALVPLARTGAKASLELTETTRGLQVSALVDPRMAGARDLLLGIENGTISQMSVGMQVDPTGDVWSGEDQYGMANVRDIYRLANVFDASAVAFPANPNTALDLASARMAELPPEVTVRVQRLEQLAKEGRAGTITQSDSDDLLALLRHLFSASGERNAPTAQDGPISKAITAAHQATGAAIAAQMKDPDNNTDPVDKKVMASLTSAHEALTTAMQHQAKDGTPDADAPSSEGGDDGTQGGGSGADAGIGNEDGTGSRSVAPLIDRMIQVDQDRLRLNRPPVFV